MQMLKRRISRTWDQKHRKWYHVAAAICETGLGTDTDMSGVSAFTHGYLQPSTHDDEIKSEVRVYKGNRSEGSWEMGVDYQVFETYTPLYSLAQGFNLYMFVIEGTNYFNNK